MQVRQSFKTDFRSEKTQRFFDLQLSIQKDLEASLDSYITEQRLDEDNMYMTEEYGKQIAIKGNCLCYRGVKISRLPAILMIQLKRFQFNQFTERNEKVLQSYKYPERINFARWTTSQQPQKYSLYGVLVHQGSKSQSGHYYVYLNIKDIWYKFNDQKVISVSKEMVFNNNFGGQSAGVEFDQRELKVNQVINKAKATAYMLVYVSDNFREKLLSGSSIYPEWILQRKIDKIQQQNEKKEKKNYFSDIKLYSWEKNIWGKNSTHQGLFSIEDEQPSQDVVVIDKLYKNQKINQWKDQLPFEKQSGIYVHYYHNQKQLLVSMSTKNNTNVINDLFKDSYMPSIVIFPVKALANQFLVITKLFKVKPDQSFQMNFDWCFTFEKDKKYEELVHKLNTHYQQKGWIIKFYTEDTKNGVVQLNPINQMIKANNPQRNCLFIVMIEKIAEEVELKNYLVQWYNKQWNKTQISVRSLDTAYSFKLNVDRSQSITQLRKAIYQNISSDTKYLSPEHIVIQAKIRKNSKLYIETTKEELIKDLIKYDSTIIFAPSLIKIQQRIHQIQCHFYYKLKNGKYSDQILCIIDKKILPNDLYKLITENETIKANLQKQQMKSARILLMNKDGLMIHDIADQKGLIISKIELLGYISKERNYLMVIQGQMELQFQKQDQYLILIHHETRTGQRFGVPKCLSFNKHTNLNDLRMNILEMLSHENFIWEEKQIPCNPYKTKITLYNKEISRGIQLLEEEVIQQQESLQPASQSKNSRNGKSKSLKLPKTLFTTFQKNSVLRIQITHLYVAKSIQKLRIDV